MKRLLILLAVIFLLLGVFAQSSLAYSYVQGCVVDAKTGKSWAHGGTVYLDSGVFGTKTTSLDSAGCFRSSLPISAFGSPETTVRVDLDPGPAGDPPPEDLCVVPKDNTSGPDAVYDCGTLTASVGPNAVYLIHMEAGPSSSLGTSFLLTVVGLVSVLGFGVFWRRRHGL